MNTGACPHGLRDTHQAITMGDGAPWSWNMFRVFFPGAIQILDFYHLAENANKCRKKIFGNDEKPGKIWVKNLLHVAKHQGGEAAIKRLQNSKHKRKKAIKGLLVYMTNNRSRMNYPEYLAAGFPIGSGRVESVCKNIVTKRLKSVRHALTPEDAQKIANLRYLWLGLYWEDYWTPKKRAG